MKKRLTIQFLLALLLIGDLQAQKAATQIKKAQPRSGQSIFKKQTYVASKFSGDQRTCHTNEVDAKLRAKFPQMPSFEEYNQQLNRVIETYKSQKGGQRMMAEVLTIPVIVHVIHSGQSVGVSPNISAAQIYSQIDVMNEDFRRKEGTNGYNNNPVGADVEIQFALAVIDPNGNTLAEPGIDRVQKAQQYWPEDSQIDSELKPDTYWDPNRYLNMWTVDFGPTSDLLGYAQFPSSSNLPGLDTNGGPASTDGVVMRYSAFGRVGDVQAPYDLGRTTTHEVGHWLGLRHIWGDGSNCATDYCADTPPASDPNYECSTNNSCSGDALNDMIENYMDYTTDVCMNIFTADQKTRMRAVMEVSPRRKELKTSTVHIGGPQPPTAYFELNKTAVCVGEVINLEDQSSNSPSSWSWIVTDENENQIFTGSQQNTSFSISSPGVYYVSLTVSNENGSTSFISQSPIQVLNNQILDTPWQDDMESELVLDGWSVVDLSGDGYSWELSNEASANGQGSHSLFMDNYDNSKSGNDDALISPLIDLSSTDSYTFSLNYAYAPYDDESIDYLSVQYSLDCGASWEILWRKGGIELATAPNNGNFFTPNASQWEELVLDLSTLQGNDQVYLSVLNESGYGNVIWVDNFSISSCASVPTVSVSSSHVNGICEGEEVTLTASSSSSTDFTWLDAEGNVIHEGNSYAYLAEMNLSFDVVAAGNEEGCHGNSTYTQLVFEKPSVPNYVVNDIERNIRIVTIHDVQWLLNGEPIEGETNNTFIPSENGSYQFQLTSADGCISISNNILVDFVLGINNGWNKSVKIFPNPSNGLIQLEGLDLNQRYQLTIVDAKGQDVLSTHFNNQTLDITSLPSGLYFLKIQGIEGVANYKIVRE